MGPGIAISASEQTIAVTAPLEEASRVRVQVIAPKVEDERRIYRAPRIIVPAHLAKHRLAARHRVKQVATVARSPNSHAKVADAPTPVPPKPITHQVATLPPKVDAPPVPTADAQVPPWPSPMHAEEPDRPDPQVEKEVKKELEEPKIDPDELSVRMADISSGDIPTLNEPVASVPVPVPLPKELDEQMPREVLVAQQVDAARRYLVRVACPGNTMSRQGEDLAIGRLHPVFAVRLAAAIKQARKEGLPGVCPFSTYRPPAFGVGGYSDKYNSMHAYGLAADMSGIGRPGSTQALTWWRVVHQNGLYLPYGPFNHAEWNHTQLLPEKGRQFVASSPVRRTISRYGPISLMAMWMAAGVDMLKVTPDRPTKEPMPSPSARAAVERVRRHRRHSAPVERELSGAIEAKINSTSELRIKRDFAN